MLLDLRDLDLSKATKHTPIPGERFPLQMRSQRFGVIPFDKEPEIHLENLPPLTPAHAPKLAVRFRDYLPWFVLTATHERAQWEEIRLAFDMMNMTGAQIKYYDFQMIEHHGMMVRRGHRWTDFENRIHFGRHQGGCYTVRYAGLTTAIYTVLRQFEPLEKVVARWERGHPPHLEMRFSLQGNTDPRLREACQRTGIRIMRDSLWTH